MINNETPRVAAKQVKSIEIQVTPEKLKGRGISDEVGLGAAGGVGTDNNNEEEKQSKKRRRRRTK